MSAFRIAMFLTVVGCARQTFAAASTCPLSSFSRRALPGQSDVERHRTYLQHCALDEVVALTSALVKFETVSAQVPASKSAAFAAMGKFLRQWAVRNGLSFREIGQRAVFEVGWGSGPPLLGFSMHGAQGKGVGNYR